MFLVAELFLPATQKCLCCLTSLLVEAALPTAEATSTGHHQSAASQPSEQPLTSSSLQQAAPLASAQGSGASPFSQVSGQAAFSDNLDTAMPASAPSNAHQPGSIPHLPEAHQPSGPSAGSPFEHPEEQDRVTAAQPPMQSEGAGHSMPQALRSSGFDAAGSGHNPSDAQVRNSLTAASQPLPPESTADIDATGVDDRQMTISSGSALAEAVQAENASASIQGKSPKSSPTGQSTTVGPGTDADSGTPVAETDLFSGLQLESKSGAD